MLTADTALAPWIWSVPSGRSWIGRLARKVYCARHAEKLRMFFLGMLAADSEMSHEDKRGYLAWLSSVDWPAFLGTVRDAACWKLYVNKEVSPIDATLFSGINSEYRRLFRCFKSGAKPWQNGVI